MSEDRSGTRRRPVNVIVGTLAVLLLCFLLGGLLLPGMSSGPAPKRMQCIKNQRNVALALLTYEARKQKFPGYLNRRGDQRVSYVISILPELGRIDLFDLWNRSPEEARTLSINLDYVTCPSDVFDDDQTARLSYVVNSGEAEIEKQANGIFFDHVSETPVTTSMAYIARHDGASYTLLLSENLQAETWRVNDARDARLWTTIVWNAKRPVDLAWLINHEVKALPHPTAWQSGTRSVGLASASSITPISDLKYARPSSNHASGVNMAFCDGSVRYISNDIDYDVYCQLMTPFGDESSDTVNREITDADVNK